MKDHPLQRWEYGRVVNQRKADLQRVYISGHMIQMVMQRANAKRDNRAKDMLWSSAIFGGQEQENGAKKNECTQKSADNQRFCCAENQDWKCSEEQRISYV